MSVNKKLNEKRVTETSRNIRRAIRSLTVPNRLNKLPMTINVENAKKLKKVIGDRFYYQPPINDRTKGSLYDVKTRKHLGRVSKYGNTYNISTKFSNGSKPVMGVRLTEKEFFKSPSNEAARKIQKMFIDKTDVLQDKIMLETVNRNFYIQWKTGDKTHRYKPETFLKLMKSQKPARFSSFDTLISVLNNKDIRNMKLTFKDPFTRTMIPFSSVKIMVNGNNRMNKFRNDKHKKEVEKYAKEMNIVPADVLFIVDEIFDFMRLFPIMNKIAKKTGDPTGIITLMLKIYSQPQYLIKMEPKKIITSGERLYKRALDWYKTGDYKKLVSEIKRTNGMLDDMRF